jgi:hypothetical protein
MNEFLRQLRVRRDFVTVIRKLTIGHMIFSLQFNIVYSGFFMYCIFFDDTKYFSFLIAPFDAVFPINGSWIYAIKFIYCIVTLLAIQTYLWPATMDHVLTEILIKQFQLVNKRFRICCTQRGYFNESLKTFRNRHQALCRAVRTADSFFMLTNVCFCCQMFTVIILCYAIAFIQIQNGAVANIYFILLVTSIVGLAVYTRNGTLLNNSVRTIQLLFALCKLEHIVLCMCNMC